MREHPIPQDITNYKFHLIGSMTLKQFAELVVGVIIAMAFYQTNLPTILKWFFIIFGVLLGFAMAFVPFEERPLDHWVITFFKKLYAPSKFYWSKRPKIPSAFEYVPNKSRLREENQVDLSPIRREKIKEFLKSIKNPVVKDDWELDQDQKVNQVLQKFDQVSTPQLDLSSSTVNKSRRPDLKVRVRSMKSNPKEQVVFTQGEPSPAEDTITSSTQEKKESQTSQATTNRDLPFPSNPDEPNRLVGMILSPQGDLLDNTTIEVKNEQGQNVAAIKSNSLGQFSLSSSLPNGSYFLEIRKNGYDFEKIGISLEGEIIPPLEIRGVPSTQSTGYI